jgi:hypothetical protein
VAAQYFESKSALSVSSVTASKNTVDGAVTLGAFGSIFWGAIGAGFCVGASIKASGSWIDGVAADPSETCSFCSLVIAARP